MKKFLNGFIVISNKSVKRIPSIYIITLLLHLKLSYLMLDPNSYRDTLINQV